MQQQQQQQPDQTIPVTFTIERNGQANITTEEYVELMKKSRTYTVSSGRFAAVYNIIHTSVGYVSICCANNEPKARWITDPFTIVSVVADENGDHFAEIAVSSGKKARIAFEDLLPNKIEATLFNKGIAMSKESRIREVIAMHLQWLLGQFEVQDAKITLGWKYKDSALTWCGTNNDPPLLQYRLSLDSEEKYFDALNSYLDGCTALQFILCSAAASTLLAYLNMTAVVPVASFGVSLVGTSSTGKTTALQLAASLYSAPNDECIYNGFYGTANALIHLLGQHQGIPICYDESTIDNQMNKASFVYAFAEGKSKLRLGQQSQLKERDTWLCTCLFSSETPLIDISENDNLGLGVRILNLEEQTYTKDSTHADNIKMFCSSNYGIVGEMLAEYLLKAEPVEMLEDYNSIKNAMNSLTTLDRCKLTDRLILNLSLIMHTAAILKELGIQLDIAAIRDICVNINNSTAESAEKGKNAICKIFNYIASKYDKIKGIKWTADKDGNPIKAAIVETTFKEILEECGITDVKGAASAIDKEGYLIRQSKNRLKSKLSIDGVSCYAYQFDMAKVNGAFEGFTDDRFSNIRKYKSYDPFSGETLDIVNDSEAIIHEGNYKTIGEKTATGGKAFLLYSVLLQY